MTLGDSGTKLIRREDEWVWGWDPTPGIVSVWADLDGRAIIWRRLPDTGELVREEERFRPWLLLDRLDDLQRIGESVTYRELEGPGALRFLVSGVSGRALVSMVLDGASRRLGRRVTRLSDLGKESALALPPEEQYLVTSGRTYFRGLSFDQLRRMQFDLETTGLNADHDRIFLIAVRYPSGEAETLEARGDGGAAEAGLIRELVARVTEADPDVIENH